MDRKDFSQKQLKVIDSESNRILVSASAGSGKTTVMIERIATLLIDNKCKTDEILVCTFTKSSAADMRAKLYVKLFSSGHKEMLADLVRADISTIDSFCQKTVKRYFFELGIDPEFEVIDEDESVTGLGEALNSVIKQNADISAACELMSGRSGQTFKDIVTDVCKKMRSTGDMQQKFEYDVSVQSKIDESFAERKKKLIRRAEILRCDGLEKYADIFVEALEQGTFLPTIRCAGLSTDRAACVNVLKVDVKDYLEEFNKAKDLRRQECGYLDLIYDTARKAIAEYDEAKRKADKLDFADLELLMYKLLDTDAVFELRKKYKYIFVDEYQDINPLQEKIISAIAKESNLFMVGDLKQSIYAFRGCDPRIFKAKYDRYKATGEGEVIDLDDNYRSSEAIISAVNTVFNELMTADFGGIDYAKNPMRAVNEGKGEVIFNVVEPQSKTVDLPRVYSVKNHDCFKESDSIAEATAAVNLIVELIGKEGGKECYGDIAVLSRNGDAPVTNEMMRMLKELNIPFSVKDKKYYAKDAVVGQLVAYMRIIDNFLDDKSLAVAMLSVIGGFSEDELADIKLHGGKQFCESVLQSRDEKVMRFVGKVNEYRKLKATCTASEIANIIVSENGYFNYAYSYGDDCAELLDRFLGYLASLKNKDLYSALRTLDKSNAYAESGEKGNTVKFMTIHKSKGLEFKYVLIVGLSGSFNTDDLGKRMIGDGMCLYENHETVDTDMRFAEAIALKKQLLEENMRVLYVAMTRAKKGLYLFASVKKEHDVVTAYESQWQNGIVDLSLSKCYYDWLSPIFVHKRKIKDVEPLINDNTVIDGEADERLVKMLKAYFDMPFPTYAPSKSYVSLIAHAGDEETLAPPTPLYSDEDAFERGNAYHRTMQLIDFDNPDFSAVSPSDLKLIDKQRILAAAQNMRVFSGEIYKEQPFMIKKNGAEIGLDGEGEVLVQGVIDLLVIDGDNAVVVDYKTGRPHSRFEAGYFKQVELYAEAVQKLLNKKVTAKFLYYFATDSFVEVK